MIPTLIVFASLFFLLASGMWLAIASALIGLVILFLASGWNNLILSSSMAVWAAADSISLASAALFIFMGAMLTHSKIGERTYASVAPLLSRLPGGLLYANIIAGSLFAACNGSALASTVTIGSVALPEMEKRGYPFSMSAGSVGAAGLLAPIIPPSIFMIFYASAVEVSIGQLFIAGVVPGLMLIGLFIIFISIRFRFFSSWQDVRSEVRPWKESIAKLKDAWVVVALIAIVLGSIFLGIATPTEAGAIGALGAIILAVMNRGFSWATLKKAVFATVRLQSQLLFIYLGIKLMTAGMARTGMIYKTTNAVMGLSVSPLVILIMVYLLFLILGTVIEGIPLMLMLVPVVFPAIAALGYDPVWFGVVVVLLCLVGDCTPPVGIIIFGLQALEPKKPVQEIYSGLLPFWLITLGVAVLLIAFPDLVLFLPRLMTG